MPRTSTQVGSRWPVRRWVLACAGAEAIGMTAAASAAQLADDVSSAGRAPVLALAIVVAGGLVEGAALGGLQARVLGDVLGPVAARRWVLVTLVVAGVGWAAASAPAVLAPGGAEQTAPSLWLLVVAAAGLGLGMGIALGLAQAWALRGHARTPWRWVAVSACAWTPTMVVMFLGATLPTAVWSTASVVLLGAVTGAVSGVVLGCISGPLLVTLDGSSVHNELALLALLTPARRLLGRSLIGLRITGRRSDRRVRLPVQHAADDVGLVVMPGNPEQKKWWRNLRGGADVEVLAAGRWSSAWAEVLMPGDMDHAVAAGTYRRRYPRADVAPDQPLVRIRSGRP